MVILVVFFLGLCGTISWSQGIDADETHTDEDVEEDILGEEELKVKIEPIFPEENRFLIFIEGEDSVSTNFNKESIINYSCSGSRTLELDRATSLHGGAAFYADFVFYVEESGMYELWYGGTPPGPQAELAPTKDEIIPSYASPFEYYIDDPGNTVRKYRENVHVVEAYTPVYYWNLVGDQELTKGRHQMRLQIKEKRGFDGKYYFYIDALFFVRKEGGKRIVGEKVPDVFPVDMNNRSIDDYFKTMDDYLILIRERPEDIEPLKTLALVYYYAGDYLKAIKYIKRALIIDPENIEAKLLMAKTYIKKGEQSKGLDIYEELLEKNPKLLGIWMWAGKLSAWSGQYNDSIDIFNKGLSVFIDNPDLLVNLGLTYLWSGKLDEADRVLNKAKEIAGDNPEQIKKLAKVFVVNGYQDMAIDIYKAGLKVAPADLELYLLLEDIYFNYGKKKQADQVSEIIRKRFKASEKLSRYLDLFHEKMGLKDRVIENYRQRLAAQPDNLELREMLAQTYFWNGLRDEAISEYLKILTTHAFRHVSSLDESSSDLLRQFDYFYLLEGYFSEVGERFDKKRKEIDAGASEYRKALSDLDKFVKAKEAAEAKGKEVSVPDPDPYRAAEASGGKLGSLLADAAELIRQYGRAYNIVEKEITAAGGLEEKSNRESEVFDKLIESIDWKWDENRTIDELEEVSGDGLVLADYLIGRIAQYENRPGEADERFVKILGESDSIQIIYAYVENCVWRNDTKKARALIGTYGARLTGYAPYLSGLRDLSEDLGREYANTAGSLPGDAETAVKQVTNNLEVLSGDAKAQLKKLEGALLNLHDIMRRKLERTFYSYQESTYLLRNELGDFYMSKRDLPKAIEQYRQVLAIDPYNLEAIYRLATVYLYNQNWSEAMTYLRKVYETDPTYENATSLYNSLARRYADAFKLSTYGFADTSRMIWHAGVTYEKQWNSMLGMKLGYATDFTRYYKIPEAGKKPYTYQTHSLDGGLVFDFYNIGLKLYPFGGTYFLLHDAFYAQENDPDNFSENLSIIDYFMYQTLAPYAGIDFTASVVQDVFSLYGTVGYRPYPDTLAYHIEDAYEVWGVVNLFMKFPFLGGFPLNSSYIRAYAPVDFLITGDLIIKPGADLYLPLFGLQNPYSSLSIVGNIGLEHTISDRLESIEFYTPEGVFQALGGLDYSILFGEKNQPEVSGFSIKAMGGYMTEYMGTADQIDRLKITGEGKFEYKKEGAVFTVGADANITYRLTPEKETGDDPVDYWGFALRIGYSMAVANLLAP
ncbi:MAG: tetratricopeptide repeat protein [Spirochaetales bacterium]|nr:tetratricopeptide repeat protein [Spirochaetales bacterium]